MTTMERAQKAVEGLAEHFKGKSWVSDCVVRRRDDKQIVLRVKAVGHLTLEQYKGVPREFDGFDVELVGAGAIEEDLVAS